MMLNELYGFIVDFTDKYFYVRDTYRNILGIIDTNGNLVVQYTYSAYGSCTSISGSLSSTIGVINPFRYKGYYYDSEAQLFYYSSRYYSPELCRWISPDSIEYLDQESINGLNLYAYCNNDPVNYYDPTGHSAILIAIAIGAVLGGIYDGISAAANGQNVLVGVTNAVLALVGRGFSKVDSMNNLKDLGKILYGTMTNSPLLGLGMAINMGISKHAPVYTIEDLYNDTFGKHKKLKWRW